MADVKLGGYPAKRCAHRIHNQFAPGTPEPMLVPPEVQALWDAGTVFEAEIIDELRRCYAGSPALVVLDESNDWAADQHRTVEAMKSGVTMIVNGRLPDVNGRTGAPDVLIHHRGGYLPVDIKYHQTLSASRNPVRSRSRVEVSALTAPDEHLLCPGYSNHGGRWRDDVMQLSHYTRMLQELGLHPDGGPNLGGVIGTSDLTPLTGDGHGITWYDLDAANIQTYSATAPTRRKRRSPLQRYDHEFAFRVSVAEAAQAGGELVRPYRITECSTCEWFDYCRQVAGPDDASFATEAGHLNVREWQYLYRHCGSDGTLSVTGLAGIDPQEHAQGFREQSIGTGNPGRRLAAVVKRARMTTAGVDVEPLDPNPPPVPTADIEVDFDIEWDAGGRIYLWGLRIRDDQNDTAARYEPVVSFAPLDEAASIALAGKFAARIRELRAAADRDGKSLRIFHWHNPETTRTREFPDVTAALDGLTFDLLSWFNAHYFARTSSSIKAVAPIFGFRWSVDDPGGLVSQVTIDVARGTGPEAEAARRWCLAYNESDVAAQAAVRDGLRRNQFLIRP